MTHHFRSSTAVMQRRIEPADSLDFFPTPPWATRALCEHVLPRVWHAADRFDCYATDPACGEGHMAAVLGEYFPYVRAADIHPYGFGLVENFLDVGWNDDWIITNPPFNAAPAFIDHALQLATRGVAILGRSALLEGQERYAEIYTDRPPHYVFQFVERVPMHRGRWVVNGKSATSYAWFVWLAEPSIDVARFAPLLRFIPPCRKALTRADDALRFSGCMDLPKSHPAVQLMEAA